MTVQGERFHKHLCQLMGNNNHVTCFEQALSSSRLLVSELRDNEPWLLRRFARRLWRSLPLMPSIARCLYKLLEGTQVVYRNRGEKGQAFASTASTVCEEDLSLFLSPSLARGEKALLQLRRAP